MKTMNQMRKTIAVLICGSFLILLNACSKDVNDGGNPEANSISEYIANLSYNQNALFVYLLNTLFSQLQTGKQSCWRIIQHKEYAYTQKISRI